MKHFLNTQDWTRAELDATLAQAAAFKAGQGGQRIGKFRRQRRTVFFVVRFIELGHDVHVHTSGPYRSPQFLLQQGFFGGIDSVIGIVAHFDQLAALAVFFRMDFRILTHFINF